MNNYYIWLTDYLVEDQKHRLGDYGLLLRHLYNREFYYDQDVAPHDEQRSVDGLQLRHKFEESCGNRSIDPFDHLDGQCSVLEMLVALAMRIDKEVLGDPYDIDRTPEWFWMLIKNLGLDKMTNDKYDPNKVDATLNIFLDREYDCMGKGSLFPCTAPKDMRKCDIWSQLNYWAEENFPISF